MKTKGMEDFFLSFYVCHFFLLFHHKFVSLVDKSPKTGVILVDRLPKNDTLEQFSEIDTKMHAFIALSLLSQFVWFDVDTH
ncbi:hypothetical protein DFR44_13012 [Hydromonas duriensis]|uniref:Uncharacterized protein n=1 Tax=Hydromonas duriensis TaxID=1527608 RepID=A0A4R6Y5R4_9BURK|nr:hypothetical protein DFR44_13012 [Hydromonas duriensis]